MATRFSLQYRKFYNCVTPTSLKTMYIAYVQPHLECAVPAWDPHLKIDVMALESVQRLATKMRTKVWNTVSYKDRLFTLYYLSITLETGENISNYATCSYKLINNYFPNSPLSTSYATRSHELILHVPF